MRQSRDAQIAKIATPLIASEIVGPHGAAQTGPAVGAPVIDQSNL
jgi:hypothetical protein